MAPRLSLLIRALAVVALVGCNRSSETLLGPITELTQEEIDALASGGDLFPVGELDPEAEREGRLAAEAAAKATVDSYLAAHPELQEAFDFSAPTSVELPGGNYEVELPDGQKVVLLGEGRQLRALAEVIDQIDDPAPNLEMLADVAPRVPEPCAALAPPEAQWASMTAAELRASSSELARCWDEWRSFADPFDEDVVSPGADEISPSNPTGQCNVPLVDIEGGGNDGECWSNPQDDLIRGFAYHDDLSAIRQQGTRGSCVAFGIASALEYAIRRTQGIDLDVSEQSLYSMGKWDMERAHWDDGLSTFGFADWLDDSNAHIQLEDTWGYNPSWCRLVIESSEQYRDSCVGYGTWCSESAHQMGLVSGPDGELQLYRPTDPATDVEVTGAYPITLFDIALAGPELVNAAVDSGKGAVASLRISKDFKAAEPTGYLPAVDNTHDGGHAVQIVRVVEDSDAPGGYWVVIKNSWGCGFGDGGFAYLDLAWFMAHANYVVVFGAKDIDNSAPTISITQPSGPVSQPAGGLGNTLTLSAAVSDPEEGADCCLVTWTSSIDGVLGNGNPLNATLYGTGTRVITATTRDVYGFLAQDTVEIELTNDAPKPVITRPEWEPHGPNEFLGMRVPVGVYVPFSGTAFDPNGFVEIPCASRQWTFTTETGTSVTPASCSSKTSFLAPTWVRVDYEATDADGATGLDTRWVRVVEWGPTDLPYVQISSPPEDGWFVVDPDQRLFLTAEVASGTGADPAVRWVLVDGGTETEIATGSTFGWIPSDDVGFNCGGREVTVRAEATDANGTTTDELTLYIYYPVC